jgi:tripartite ATP-independent transporter DctM subunit
VATVDDLDVSDDAGGGHVITAVRRVVDVLLVAAVVGELLIVLGNVISRGLFGYSFLWESSVDPIALAAIAFLGGAASYGRGEDMSLTFVVDHLPPRLGRIGRCAGVWFTFGIAGLVAGLSVPVMLANAAGRLQFLGWSSAVPDIPLTIGMLAICVFAADRLLTEHRGWRAGAVGLVMAAIGVGVGLWVWLGGAFGSGVGDTVIWVAIVVAVLFLLLAVPIAVALASAGALFILLSGAAPWTSIDLQIMDGTNSYVLLAVPFFVLAGLMIASGGLSIRLANLVDALVGRIPGGILHVVVVTMYLFSGISGSKAADIAAVGTPLREVAEKNGQKPGETAAVLAASAMMGEVVPPSIAILVLSSVTSVSVVTLFTAGLVPAAAIAIILMVTIYLRARRTGATGTRRVSSIRRALLQGIVPLLIPVVLAGGILLGIGTPTEISSVAVVVGVILLLVFAGKKGARELPGLLVRSSALAGSVLLIVAAASVFSWALSYVGIPQSIASFLSSVHGGKPTFWVVTVVVLLVLGLVLEGLPGVIIFAPLLLPSAQGLGINLVQFSIVLLLALGIGTFTPPLGVGAFVAARIAKARIEDMIRPMSWYLVAVLAGVLLIIGVPWLSTFVPNAIGLH